MVQHDEAPTDRYWRRKTLGCECCWLHSTRKHGSRVGWYIGRKYNWLISCVCSGWSLPVIGDSPLDNFDVIAFSTSWQLEVTRSIGIQPIDLLSQSSTITDFTKVRPNRYDGHNAQCRQRFARKQLYLYTLVVKNKRTQRGTPVGFMMTEAPSQ